jgi:hypothetical protein
MRIVNDVRIHPIRKANLSGRQPSICGKTAAIYRTRLRWLIGFGKDVEKNLLEAISPFVFSTVNERSILRFLKLIACDNGKIGTYAKLVDDRNDTAHPVSSVSCGVSYHIRSLTPDFGISQPCLPPRKSPPHWQRSSLPSPRSRTPSAQSISTTNTGC